MITKLFDSFEAYESIMLDCYNRSEANKRIKCSKYLNEYLNRKWIASDIPNKHIIKDYFLKWLPYAVCENDEILVEHFYPAAEEYFRIMSFFEGMPKYKSIDFADSDIRFEAERLMHLKISIMRLTNSFIISRFPYIIELERYKRKKAVCAYGSRYDRGDFIVQGYFSGDSVVLKKIRGGNYYIRLYFNGSVMALIRDNDVLDINIVKNTESDRWKLEDINGCFLGNRVLI